MTKKYIDDFDYGTILNKLKKKIPSFAKGVFPLYVALAEVGKTDSDFSYWKPESVKGIENTLFDLLHSLEVAGRKGEFNNEPDYLCGTGGLVIDLSVADDTLEGTLHFDIEEGFFTDK